MIKKYSELNNIKVEKVIFNGFGLAHYQDKIIMIYQGITGDDVDVSIIHKRGDTYFGVITKYNSKSNYQIPVTCSQFDSCGGCDWLNISYETQLELKQQIFAEIFRNIPNNVIKEPITPSPKVNHYRNKIILPVTMADDKIISGMYERRSHNVIPHQDCILHPEGAEGIIELTEELLTKANVTVYDEASGKGNLRFIGIRYSATRKEYLLIIVTKSAKLPFSKVLADTINKEFKNVVGIVQDINSSISNRNISANGKIISGRDYITEDLHGTALKIHYSSFFQINTEQSINVLKTISGILQPDNIVIDAYSGIGTFGVSIAKQVKKVICLEQHPEAVANGLSNIKENGLDNCIYMAGKVEDTLPTVIDHHQADTIIFDPPRKGIDRSLIESINLSPISKIIYLSCNISTQKRDIDLFLKGGFRLVKLQPFDMFPHTHHIECLALLER